MNPVLKFTLRAAVGLGLAYFMMRIYIKQNNIGWTLVMAAFLVGMAYLAERLRKNRE